jgi:FixJ family two-component response regulator
MGTKVQCLSDAFGCYHTTVMTALRQMIAVVDDDESVRKAMCRLLRTAGFDSRGFASGQEFLEAWLQDPPDCVVLDLQMPGLSGIEVQYQLNRLPQRAATIFITAHDRPQARQECLEAGATAYLRKPVDAHTLLETIRQALGRKANCPDGRPG